MPGQPQHHQRSHGGAGHRHPRQARQPVLQERSQPQGALPIRRGADDVEGDHEEGGRERRHPRELGEEVRQGHGEDVAHRDQDRRQRRDQEELPSRQLDDT